MFSETHFVFLLLEFNLVFMLFALIVFGNPPMELLSRFHFKKVNVNSPVKFSKVSAKLSSNSAVCQQPFICSAFSVFFIMKITSILTDWFKLIHTFYLLKSTVEFIHRSFTSIVIQCNEGAISLKGSSPLF